MKESFQIPRTQRPWNSKDNENYFHTSGADSNNSTCYLMGK